MQPFLVQDDEMDKFWSSHVLRSIDASCIWHLLDVQIIISSLLFRDPVFYHSSLNPFYILIRFYLVTPSISFGLEVAGSLES